MINKKLDGIIGIAVKAGKVAFGSEASVDYARNRKAKLVIIAKDASDRTKKLVNNKCNSFKVPVFEYQSIEHISRITGKRIVSVISVSDKGLAEAMLKIYGGGLDGKSL